MASAGWIDAQGAARFLGVKRETLYAYVSRGLVRARPAADRKARLYQRADLERLRAKSRARSGHGAAAASALRFGEPVLDSALTQISEHGPSYRGFLALELAEKERFERVAELLWTGALPRSSACFGPVAFETRAERLRRSLDEKDGPLAALELVLLTSNPASELGSARKLVRQLASAPALLRGAGCVERSLAQGSVAEALLVALGSEPDRTSAAAVNQALVLCADHELNPSSFVTRVAASVGASLSRSMLAALATFSGPLHGGACDRIERFVAGLDRPEDVIRAVSQALDRGESVPGFGHPLYPAGDPRARPLLARARVLSGASSAVRTALALIDAVALAGNEQPTLDAGLVALAAALELPPGSASALFAVGRSAGWIAHALEQQSLGFVMRPRARYAPNL